MIYNFSGKKYVSCKFVRYEFTLKLIKIYNEDKSSLLRYFTPEKKKS